MIFKPSIYGAGYKLVWFMPQKGCKHQVGMLQACFHFLAKLGYGKATRPNGKSNLVFLMAGLICFGANATPTIGCMCLPFLGLALN